MLITVKPGSDAARVARELAARGLWVRRLEGASVHFLVESHSAQVDPASLRDVPGVADVAVAASPHPLLDAMPRTVTVRGIALGAGAAPVLMAGPCSIESEEQIDLVASQVAAAGARLVRGGAFKPRTSPYGFQGHGHKALQWIRRAADAHDLGVVTEAMSEGDVESVAEHADLVQLGSRNMQNFALLRAVGRTRRPVLLKRGMAATLDEWLLAAEHLLVAGAPAVVLCERGVRGFDGATRNLLDLGAVALLAHVHGLPVVVDPSHATGRRDLVLPLGRAALAAGACGLLVETHPDPGAALSDGPQALSPQELIRLADATGPQRSRP